MGEHVCDFSSGCSKKGSVCDFRGAVDSAVGGGWGKGKSAKRAHGLRTGVVEERNEFANVPTSKLGLKR